MHLRLVSSSGDENNIDHKTLERKGGGTGLNNKDMPHRMRPLTEGGSRGLLRRLRRILCTCVLQAKHDSLDCNPITVFFSVLLQSPLQAFLAMGFFALTIMRRWKKWARREAGMRRLFEKLSIGNALRRWKQAARIGAFRATLQRLVLRGALRHWKRELRRRAALEMAGVHCSRSLVSKVGRRFREYLMPRSIVADLGATILLGQGFNGQAL